MRAPTQHELFDISRLVLRRYPRNLCVSGTATRWKATSTPVRPRSAGRWIVDPVNFIALWARWGSAFSARHFTIGTSYELIVNVTTGSIPGWRCIFCGLKLRLPDQEEDWPSQEHLAYHRRFVFRG